MFNWLDEEMALIKTPKFHLVDGLASDELRQAVESSNFPLPPSYRQFVLRFGNAKLYRWSNTWQVRVYAGPREDVSEDGEPLIHFGRTQSALAYFKESLLISGEESPIFEWRHGQGVRQVAQGFEDWLDARCNSAREKYTKTEWDKIVRGPHPFTDRERAIVEARRCFHWRLVGIAPNGDLRFEIHNESSITLPYLTIGVRGKLRAPKNGDLGDCTIYLPTASIGPGETAVVGLACYKTLVAPEDAVVFSVPDPGPEDRDLDLFGEFKA